MLHARIARPICYNIKLARPFLSRAIMSSTNPQNSEKPYVYHPVPFRKELQDVVDKNFRVVKDDELEKYRSQIVSIIVHVRPRITKPLLESFPNLKVIGSCAVGYDNIDVKACQSLGIRVGYTPDVLNETTADMAVTLLLATARRVVEGDKMAKDPNFAVMETGWFGYQVSGTTVGIVGLGRIGLEIAKRLRAFNMKILYYNRNRKPIEIEEQVNGQYIPDLYSMLSQCDYVVLSAPATPSTYHMFGEKEFTSMKSTSVFVNISRGSLVNQDALVKALRENSIGAAGLDVTDPEPLPRDHPLLQLPNVTITPHTGSATMHTRMRMAQLTIDNILGGLKNSEMPAELKV